MGFCIINSSKIKILRDENAKQNHDFFLLGNSFIWNSTHTAEASRLRKATQPIQEITYTSFDATELSKIIEEFRLNNGELPHNNALLMRG